MKWFLRFFFTILLMAGWAALAYFYADFTLGSPQRDKPVEVEIPPDTSINEIGKILKQKKLIRESYFFRYYVMYKHKTNLKAGVYEIQPDETLDQMLNKFSDGNQDLVKVTIPEGLNALQIAEILEKKGFDKEGFLKALNDKPLKYNFETEIPADNNRPYRLEGYLFPSTYNFRKDATPEQIINAMLAQFSKRMDELQVRDNLKNAPLKGITVDQWVTIASLIEREGQVKEELPTISGVIYNRLNNPNNQWLGIDATIVYIYSMRGEKITKVKNPREVKSPYNTYLMKGLPPGPIASPGEESLKAALYPQEHEYEYYVTKSDCSGEHYFAKTHDEHRFKYIPLSNQNQKKYKCNP